MESCIPSNSESYLVASTINPFMDDKWLIRFTNGKMLNLAWLVGRWKRTGDIYVRLERWNAKRHSRKEVVQGYGGWIKVLDLSLMYWKKCTFEAIGSHCGGLVGISFNTLNLIDCTEAIIQVQPNKCVFLPASIEISDARLGDYVIRIEGLSHSYPSSYRPSFTKMDLQQLDNPMDMKRFYEIMEVEQLGFVDSPFIISGRRL